MGALPARMIDAEQDKLMKAGLEVFGKCAPGARLTGARFADLEGVGGSGRSPSLTVS